MWWERWAGLPPDYTGNPREAEQARKKRAKNTPFVHMGTFFAGGLWANRNDLNFTPIA